MLRKFYKLDYLDLLASMPDESVDLIVTDPPYASLEVHRAVGTTTRLTGEWFGVIPNDALPKLLSRMYRVLKPDRHAYLFTDERTAHEIRVREFTGKKGRYDAPLMKSGFTYWKELIWVKTSKKHPDKPDGGMGYHWRGANERILFLEKGKRKLANLSLTDSQQFPRIRNGVLPTQKPVALIELLTKNSCPKGGIVLDPFCGTGSTGLAAAKCGCGYVLGDITDKFLDPLIER